METVTYTVFSTIGALVLLSCVIPVTYDTSNLSADLIALLTEAEKRHKAAGLPASDWQVWYAQFLIDHGVKVSIWYRLGQWIARKTCVAVSPDCPWSVTSWFRAWRKQRAAKRYFATLPPCPCSTVVCSRKYVAYGKGDN